MQNNKTEKTVYLVKSMTIDGRHFNRGRNATGANMYPSRSKMAMALIGKDTCKSFSQLKLHKDRKNFWRAQDYLRGRVSTLNLID